jgi:cytochrome c-type biogenesis protein CcmH
MPRACDNGLRGLDYPMTWAKMALAGMAALTCLAAAPDSSGRAALSKQIEHKLMAPCCWSESVAKHISPASTEMKKQIAAMVDEGKTEREIIEHFKRQYGARILVEPEGLTGRVLTVVPLAMLALGATFTVLIIRKWRRAA